MKDQLLDGRALITYQIDFLKYSKCDTIRCLVLPSLEFSSNKIR